jgi:hypothetical protein
LPLPCPDAGESPEIQFALVDTVHAHSGCVVTANEPLPPEASIIGGLATDT